MNRTGWNGTRRNRNIGTSKQGHGTDNKLSIPQPSDTLKNFYERFDDVEIQTIKVHKRDIPVIIEKLKEGYFYSCTPTDVEHILNQLPLEDLIDLGLIIFRQSKKKEEIISPVWGRLVYSMEFKGDYYPAIILEAVPITFQFKYPLKQSVEKSQEFDLLRQDGVVFRLGKRNYIAEMNEKIIRNIQLYRTLLHELGHYVQYYNMVERPGTEVEEIEQWEKRWEEYCSIPQRDKELFANRYAVKMKKELVEKGIIPFGKITKAT